MARSPIRLSVALATYNGAKYLPVQLQSLAGQTRLPDELVVSDDGSTDATIAVLESFAATSPFPVRIHRQPTNLGPNQNFGRAIGLTTGDVIFFCDQDDRWHADKLARVAAVFEREPDVGLVMNDAALVGADLEPLGQTLWDKFAFDAARQDRAEGGDAFTMFARVMPPYGCTMAIAGGLKERVLPVGPKPVTFDAWIGGIAAVCGPCRLVRDTLQDYRQHAAQVTGFENHSKFRRTLGILLRSDTATVRKELAINDATLEKLRTLPDSPRRADALRLVGDRQSLARLRLVARRSVVRRVPAVAYGLVSGQYHRSARGFYSAVTDLLAPPTR